MRNIFYLSVIAVLFFTNCTSTTHEPSAAKAPNIVVIMADDLGYYYTIAMGDTAVSYVEAFSKDDKPFFHYVAHTAPHWPLQALPEDIQKYEDVYKVGWEPIRTVRYQRMLEPPN